MQAENGPEVCIADFPECLVLPGALPSGGAGAVQDTEVPATNSFCCCYHQPLLLLMLGCVAILRRLNVVLHGVGLRRIV